MVDLCSLPSRSLFRLSGPDTREWLQGLITADMRQLTPEAGLYTALLSPQGKILFDFFLYQSGEDVLVDCEEAQQGDLMKRLRLYKMRSDVDFVEEPDLGVVSCCSRLDDEEAVTLQVPDPRLEKLGLRLIGNRDAIVAAFAARDVPDQGEAVYREYLLKLGVPDGSRDFPSGKAYPLESNFEPLHGVSFTKGCFIGQEVTARTKHKTELRRRLLPLHVKGPMPQEETDVRTSGAKIGTLIPGAGVHALGLIRLADFKSAREAGETFHAGDVEVEIGVPDWLTL